MNDMAATLGEGRARTPARTRPRFYLWMAVAFTAIAFGGFVPTYWAKVAAGSFNGAPVLHLHGALYFSWTLMFLWQAVLVNTGRTPAHRQWGMAGVALMGAMLLTAVLVAINSMYVAERLGPQAAELGRRFAAVPLVGLPVLAGFFAYAIANVTRPEIHKRAMILVQIPLMQAAFSRLVMVVSQPADAPPGPPPGAFVSIPGGLIMDLLVVAGMIHDRRTRGRIHGVYLVGLPILVAEQLLVVPISLSPQWLSFATWLQHLVR